MGILNGGRHQRIGFIGGIAEHDALVACAFVFGGGGVDALGDMGRLFVQQIGDFHGFVVEFILFIANIADAGARDFVDPAHVFCQFGLVRQAHFAADDHAVGGGKCFAGHAGLGFLGDKGIKNCVRNTVADLVWVPL